MSVHGSPLPEADAPVLGIDHAQLDAAVHPKGRHVDGGPSLAPALAALALAGLGAPPDVVGDEGALGKVMALPVPDGLVHQLEAGGVDDGAAGPVGLREGAAVPAADAHLADADGAAADAGAAGNVGLGRFVDFQAGSDGGESRREAGRVELLRGVG